MRQLAFILLAMNFMLTPMASSLAMALGFSGEHVHFDATWHGNHVDQVADPDHDHQHDDVKHNDDAKSETHDKSAPLKHSHGEAHSAIFIVTTPAQIFLPEFASTTAPQPPSFPTQKHPYPPFRPPQAA